MEKMTNQGAGKGDRPRNNYTNQFRDNWSQINWKKVEEIITDDQKLKDFGKRLNEKLDEIAEEIANLPAEEQHELSEKAFDEIFGKEKK